MLLVAISSVFLFAAIVLLTVSFGQEKEKGVKRPEGKWKKNLNEKVRLRLRKAGYIDTEPGFAYMIMGIALGLVVLLVFIITQSFLLPVMSVPFVLGGMWLFLNAKERSYMKRAQKEIVPFLNRVQAAVGSGTSPQNAFVSSMASTRLMKEALQEEMRDLQLGEPINIVLRRSIEKYPLRAWEQFARHLTMQIERGGDIESVIAGAVEQIQGLIELQAELRADYSEAQREQMIITLIAVGILVFMNIAMGGIFLKLFDSLYGIIAFMMGVGLMGGGILLGQKGVRDIEEKLDF